MQQNWNFLTAETSDRSNEWRWTLDQEFLLFNLYLYSTIFFNATNKMTSDFGNPLRKFKLVFLGEQSGKSFIKVALYVSFNMKISFAIYFLYLYYNSCSMLKNITYFICSSLGLLQKLYCELLLLGRPIVFEFLNHRRMMAG